MGLTLPRRAGFCNEVAGHSAWPEAPPQPRRAGPSPPPASRTRTVGSGRRSTVWRAAHAGGRSLTRLQPCGHDATHEGGETKGDETENDDTSAAESSPHLGP